MEARASCWLKCDQQTSPVATRQVFTERWSVRPHPGPCILDSQVIQLHLGLRSTALGFFISFTRERGPENSSLGVLRAQRWPLANYRISPLTIGNSWKSCFGKHPRVFWQYTKKTSKIAFCTNSPKHDMSIYDLGLVELLVRRYIESTY